MFVRYGKDYVEICRHRGLEDEAKLAELFKDIREFRDELERSFNITLPELSMGMSNDYKLAVKYGATMIRIGTLLSK